MVLQMPRHMTALESRGSPESILSGNHEYRNCGGTVQARRGITLRMPRACRRQQTNIPDDVNAEDANTSLPNLAFRCQSTPARKKKLGPLRLVFEICSN